MNPSPSQPHYYAVIPSDIRYCKDLESNAKLLYGEITALCNKEGYCWASNKYFAELYDVEIRTVQRWLKSLSDNKFIFVSNEQDESKQSIRKIYLKEPSQIISRGDKNVMGGCQKCHGGGDKNVAPSIYNNTTESVVVGCGGGAPPPKNVGNVHNSKSQLDQKITKDDAYRYSLVSKMDWIPEEIEEAWIAYSNAIERIEVTDAMAYIEGIIKKKRIIKNRPKKENNKCQNSNNQTKNSNEQSENTKPKPLDYDMSVQLLARFA